MDKANRIIKLRTLAAFYRLNRITERQAVQLIKLYELAIIDILKRIQLADGAISKSKLLDRLYQMSVTLDALELKLTHTLEQAIQEAGGRTLRDVRRILSWDGKWPGFNDVDLTNEQLLALVTMQVSKSVHGDYPLKKWIGVILLDARKAIDQIRADIISGKNPIKAAQDLIAGAWRDYDKEIRRNLRTIVRTFMLGAGHIARSRIYHANRNVIDKYQWEATLEVGTGGRGTCPRCAALDGQEYDEERDAPNIPLHPNCRCILIPITDSWEKILGEAGKGIDQEYGRWFRDIDGKGQAGMDRSFADFWKELDPADQDNAIGPRRAELVRTGKVKFEDLIYDDGKLVLIKDL